MYFYIPVTTYEPWSFVDENVQQSDQCFFHSAFSALASVSLGLCKALSVPFCRATESRTPVRGLKARCPATKRWLHVGQISTVPESVEHQYIHRNLLSNIWCRAIHSSVRDRCRSP